MNADLSFQNTLHHLSKQFCQAEAKCHTLWLRLLELTIYIDQNLKINISTNNTEQREEKLIENSWNIHLLAFTSQEVS
ncbi:unnamed protein product [Trichobilharzia regenti]|nr:unnamed protein product [Trichobilharzia regenti]